MIRRIHSLLSLAFVVLICSSADAQLINMEQTWTEFLKNPKTISVSELPKPSESQTGNYLKYHLMLANTEFCADEIPDADAALEVVSNIGADQQSAIPGFVNRYKDLVEKREAYDKVNTLWLRFIESHDVTLDELQAIEKGNKLCERGTLAKYSMMEVYYNYCYGDYEDAKKVLRGKVSNLKKIYDFSKVDQLEDEYFRSKKIFSIRDKLDKAWASYMETDVSEGFEDDLPLMECNVIPNIKIHILRASKDICAYGLANLKEIKKLELINDKTLPSDVKEKLKWLKAEAGEYDGDEDVMRKAWKEFVPQDSIEDVALLDKVMGMETYCDKILQVKSWTVKGHHGDHCEARTTLDKIADFKEEHDLTFPEDLICSIRNLEIKRWDCIYWRLVRQARIETHQERERFGPASSSIMRNDLNGPQQPCETTVEYSPIGYIGVKYIISTYMCQNIDLAKMGDPEYYKKIATWVDNEVLSKYCEADLRCKEKFYIYLEGHTDGNRFGGAYYKKSLDVPEGTAFTHYEHSYNNVFDKTTRNITNKLEGNMELGIARAWTVKQQLDFMNVPITIGAYEHPESEKGGEFRKVRIELNITKLLLDFYEKRLKELIEEEQLGDRPKHCDDEEIDEEEQEKEEETIQEKIEKSAYDGSTWED